MPNEFDSNNNSILSIQDFKLEKLMSQFTNKC